MVSVALRIALLFSTFTATVAAAEPLFALDSFDSLQDPGESVTKIEWWYNISFLHGKDSHGRERKFGLLFNFARASSLEGLFPLLYPAASRDLQIMLIEYSDGQPPRSYRMQRRVTQLDPATMSVAADSSASALRGNGDDGNLEVSLAARGSDFSVDLRIKPAKPHALFGDGGYVDNGALGKALYASRTREQVQPGSLVTLEGENIPVGGTNWEDHQVTDTQITPVMWSWFAILLKDGTEVMAYRLANAVTGAEFVTYAGHVLQDGTVESSAFRVQERAQLPFTSGGTTLPVPTAWNIQLPDLGIDAQVTHELPLPRFDMTSGHLSGSFFEGPCRVQGPAEASPIELIWAEYFNSRLFGIF